MKSGDDDMEPIPQPTQGYRLRGITAVPPNSHNYGFVWLGNNVKKL